MKAWKSAAGRQAENPPLSWSIAGFDPRLTFNVSSLPRYSVGAKMRSRQLSRLTPDSLGAPSFCPTQVCAEVLSAR
jgi:hypothetical protein